MTANLTRNAELKSVKPNSVPPHALDDTAAQLLQLPAELSTQLRDTN
jgi:hypothetical protein